MKSENYGVVFDTEEKVYIIVDRNGERLVGDNFTTANLAIAYAENNCEGLC